MGGSGVNVYKIGTVYAFGDSDQPNYFTPTSKYVPSKKGLSVTDPECLSVPWHRETSRCEEIKVNGWQVVYYFDKFTQQRKIPKHKKILEIAKKHDLELFRSPDTRIFPQMLRDDSYDSAHDGNNDSEQSESDYGSSED